MRLDTLQQFAAINVLSDPGAIPGPKIIPSCAQITLRWTLASGKVAHNVLYGRYSGSFAGTVAQANAIFAALSTGAQAVALLGQMTGATAFAGVDLRDVNTPNQPLIQSTGTAAPGTGAGQQIPDEASVVSTLRTAFTGPAFRGRIYLTGFTVASVAAGNTILAATMTAINNWTATIPAAFAASGYTWVLGQPARAQYTGSTGRVHPARAATSTAISSSLVRDNHWDTQRRRGLK